MNLMRFIETGLGCLQARTGRMQIIGRDKMEEHALQVPSIGCEAETNSQSPTLTSGFGDTDVKRV